MSKSAKPVSPDDLYETIVDLLEGAAFRGEWDYPGETTALQAALQTAEVICAGLERDWKPERMSKSLKVRPAQEERIVE